MTREEFDFLMGHNDYHIVLRELDNILISHANANLKATLNSLKQELINGQIDVQHYHSRLHTFIDVVYKEFDKQIAEYQRTNYFFNSNEQFYFINATIKKFQGIKELETPILPYKTPWLIVTGENGFGKTSLLRAIALGLVGYETHNYDVNTFPEIETGYCIQTTKNSTAFFSYKLINKILKTSLLPNIICYGAYRLSLEEQENSKQTQSATKSLFETGVPLKNIELSLAEWFLKKDIADFKKKFENVTKTIKKIIPSIKEIHVKREIEGTPIFYQEQDENGILYPEMRFSQLASGYRSLIALVGDIILRLFAQQPKTTNPEDLVGIVIIDELDLHFHPKIQRRLPSLLSECFPKVQFIASTHSPIPILGAPENSAFWRVNRTPERGIFVEDMGKINVQELTPNLLLTSPLFGFEEILPEMYRKTKKVRTEDSYQDVQSNDEIEARLKAIDQYMNKPDKKV